MVNTHSKNKKIKAGIVCAIFVLVITAQAAWAATLIPVGRAVGIQMECPGALVVRLDEVATERGGVQPAREAGLAVGDLILQIDGVQPVTNEVLQQTVAQSGGRTMELVFSRNGEEHTVSVTPAQDRADGQRRLGVLVRDSMAGIGTITYVDPESGAYGSLGHGICDADSGSLIPLEDGWLLSARVSEVKRGQSGAPGSLQGEFDPTVTLGDVRQNTDAGIYGVAEQELYQGLETVETASPDAVKPGPAEILSNVSGDTVERYDIEIVKCYDEDAPDNHHMLLRVTDPDLLEQTGGIVQGMSGSPILQNGKLVGAVTHVLVGDPEQGYGIYIDTMLDAAA